MTEEVLPTELPHKASVSGSATPGRKRVVDCCKIRVVCTLEVGTITIQSILLHYLIETNPVLCRLLAHGQTESRTAT
jgi:hypothetical protein